MGKEKCIIMKKNNVNKSEVFISLVAIKNTENITNNLKIK